MSSLLDIGINSLFASKYALTVTNQNISNADNPFYTRRVVDFTEVNYSILGNGVKVSDLRRIFDDVANKNLIRSNSDFSKADCTYRELKGFETLLDNNAGSIASFIKQSVTELNTLNANAESTQSRSVYLYQLKSIAHRFNQLNSEITHAEDNLRQTLRTDLSLVNELTQKIALINGRIGASSAPALPENMPLQDERDKLLNTLAKYINFETSTDERGMVTLQVGNGTPLIVGNQAFSLLSKPSVADASMLDIAIVNGPTQMNITPFISGGELSGLLSFQQHGLNAAKTGLNRLALTIAQNMNAQNHLGVDLNGDLGANIFNDINRPDLTASRASAQSTNLGTGQMRVSIDNAGELLASDYQLEFDTSTHYQLRRLSDHQIVGTGDVALVPHHLRVDGFSLDITSNAGFMTGDKFSISPTYSAASNLELEMTDGSKLALASPIATKPLGQNKGQGLIEVDKITNINTPAFSLPRQLLPPIRVEFTSPLTYRLVSITDNTVIEDNLSYNPAKGASIFPTPGNYDPGFRINITGEVQAGDAFQIDYNLNSAGDNRNGLLLAQCYQNGALDGGTLNFVQAYNAITNDISSKTNYAKINADSQDIIKTQAELHRDQISGVSLEEETMNLARYEQAYQASAQILDAVRNMFDVVLNIMRR